MSSAAPDGYFTEGLMIFGLLENGGRAAKGYVLQMPDQRGAAIDRLNDWQDKVRSVLGLLNESLHAQFQWSCNGDYWTELTRYDRETDAIESPPIKALRRRTLAQAWNQASRRELRREDVTLFLSTRITRQPPVFKGKAGLERYYAALLAQLRGQFEELTHQLRALLSPDASVIPMDDAAHFAYAARFLNPSWSERADLDPARFFRPQLSVQENCWHSDGVSLPKIGFYLDGRYHAVFTLKRWPDPTVPGLILRLTGLPLLDFRITANVEPLVAKREVDKEEKAMERLAGEYRGTGRHSLLVSIEKKKQKIESLSSGAIRPFAVTYVIRTWDETEAGLAAKCGAIKNAINSLNGAQYYECALPSSAKKLFFLSWPGWTGSDYRHRALYAEENYLADLLPLSGTFTGHLAEAEALFPGSQHNLVGIRTFVGNPPSPQHALVSGATGAGKSMFVHHLLLQNAHRYHYTMLIEEGLSYEPFTRAMGQRPIILHPDGDLTLNYFDTRGLPLGQLQLATSVALLARMVGEAADSEGQQVRQAMLSRYVQQLYTDTFAEWSRRHSEQLPQIERQACATHRWRREKMVPGATALEAFADLRDRLSQHDDQAQSFLAATTEADITDFLKDPQTEWLLTATAHAFYQPQDFPTHASLVELMQFARFSEHPKEQVDHLATLLAAWCSRGPYGRLFDGVTNVSLTSNVAHFELGSIPEQAIELKTAAGLLIAGFARQHILSLPRAQWKRIVYEELARFLDVPGGEKIVAESYAQLRKFNCWTLSVVQQYSKFRDTRIRPVVVGNCKQFFLLRQFDRSDLTSLAQDVGLSESVCDSIQAYPMPEQLPAGKKYSSVCYFSPVSDPPLCGTVRNVELPKENSDEKLAS